MARYLGGHHHPQHALAARVIFLAEHEVLVVGYVAGHLTRRFGCDGELQWMYVVPECRGCGIASRLFLHLAQWFLVHGAKRVCVNVESENRRARTFYRRRGALEMGESWMEWPNLQQVPGLSPDSPGA
jgi:GNAT superfamily N-acetyltransferase